MAYDFSNPIAFQNAGTGGQYGYIDGLPVLDATIADSVIAANNGYVSGDAAGKADNAMGWDTGSVNGVLTNGAGVFGIRYTPESYDSDSGYIPASYSGDMDAAAKQLNIDVTGMTDAQKYNAINDAAKDLYLVSGKTGKDAGGVGETKNGVLQTAAIPNATTNHATVLYRKDGNALVPITQTAQYYNGEMELSPGSGLSDFISFAAPIALMALGVPSLSELGGAFLGGSGTDYLGSMALGDATTGAVGSGATGFGINAGAAGVGINAGTNAALANALINYPETSAGFGINSSSTGQWGLSTTPTATGINTNALNGMEYLGGTGSLPVGTAGLTADQLATATQLGQVGTNAASGLGYLGGAESLPAGTAGITGVTSSTLPSLSDLNKAQKLANQLLNKSTSQIANGMYPQTSGVGQGYSEPNPFYFPKETTTPTQQVAATQPTYLGQLAQLLRG